MSDGPGGKTCCRGDTFQSLWHRLRSPARFWRIRTFGRDSSGWHGRGLPSPATWSGFTGSSAPSIHWFFNGAILPGNSNNNSLILTWVGFTNAGAYSVTLSNDSGSVTSQPAWLSVLPTNVVSFGDRELQCTCDASGDFALHAKYVRGVSIVRPRPAMGPVLCGNQLRRHPNLVA